MYSGVNVNEAEEKKDVISNITHFGTSSSEITTNIKDLLGLGGFMGGAGNDILGKLTGSNEMEFPGLGGNNRLNEMLGINVSNKKANNNVQIKSPGIVLQNDDFPSLTDTLKK